MPQVLHYYYYKNMQKSVMTSYSTKSKNKKNLQTLSFLFTDDNECESEKVRIACVNNGVMA